MKFNPLPLNDACLIELQPYIDARGFFVRNFCKNELKSIGLDKEIVQINHSYTKDKGAFRGFHFQRPPYKEAKFVRCIRGHILDIIIDIRKNSPTFLKHCKIELSQEKFDMLYIPEGFAHGFQTLHTDCELIYMHTEFYKPAFEAGLNVFDQKLAIKLPLEISEISERDKLHPLIDENFKGI